MTLKSPSTLLKDSFDFYKQHYQILLTIAIIPAIITAIGSYLSYSSMGPLGYNPYSSSPIGGLFSLLGAIASIFAAIALVRISFNPTMYKNAVDALKASGNLFFPYLWVSILSGVVIVLGLIALIIPGIIFMVWFCFSGFILINEGTRGIPALKASKKYVEGHFMDVFVRLLVLILVMIGASIVIGIVTGALFYGSLHYAMSDLLSALIMPFAVIYVSYLYRDLKAHQSSPVMSTPTPEPAHTTPVNGGDAA